MLATYHNHTNWSDGSASIAEMVAGARRLGVDEVGLSDHFTLHPTRKELAWAMDPDRVGEYVEAVRGYAGQAAPTVRVGLEVDWFASQETLLRDTLAALPLDYTIGSVHFRSGGGGETELDGRPSVWEAWSPDEQDEVHRAYWADIGAMARSGLFDIVGHIDLTKKFGFRPHAAIDDVVDETLDAIAEAGTVVELNTNGWHCPCAEAYPSPDLLAACRRRDIPVTISSDAHHPDHLVRDFDHAARWLVDAGYEQVARFAGRATYFEPIGSAIAGSG